MYSWRNHLRADRQFVSKTQDDQMIFFVEDVCYMFYADSYCVTTPMMILIIIYIITSILVQKQEKSLFNRYFILLYYFMYINHFTDQAQFEKLWKSDQVFVIVKYSPRCPLCLDKMWDLYKRMASSKAENIYQLDVVAQPDIKTYITGQIGIEHRTPQLIMIHDKKIILQQSENDIDIDQFSKILVETMLG